MASAPAARETRRVPVAVVAIRAARPDRQSPYLAYPVYTDTYQC